MTRDPGTPPPRRGWETVLLGWLAYPANIAFAGVAGFLLALLVVTWLSAMVAAGVALHGWLRRDDDRVFTGTFRAFRDTWRRTLPLSVVATLAVAVFVVDWVFLSSRPSLPAVLMTAALVPVGLVGTLTVVHLPAAVAADPDGRPRAWLPVAVLTALSGPGRALVVLAVTFTCWALCLVVPTLVPFVALSLPVFCGLQSAHRAAAVAPR